VTKQYATVAYGRASFHAFLTSALSKRYRSAQIPGTNSMGGWVNPTAILEALEGINTSFHRCESNCYSSVFWTVPYLR